MIAYSCNANSPVTPKWSGGTPDVFWTHIICGQVTNAGVAQGFHTATSTSSWTTCVATSQCYYKSDGNGRCPHVKILDARSGYGIDKKGSSTMFAREISATNLVTYLKSIVNECKKTTSFCATGCTYKKYGRSFNIYFQMVTQGVLSAYPKSSCTTNVCAGPASCKNMA